MSVTAQTIPSQEPPYPLLDIPHVAPENEGEIVERLYRDMSLIHNVYTRGLNSIWTNAPHVRPADVPAFVGYCLAWVESVHGHHHAEESIVFPVLSKKLSMERNAEQHDEFKVGLDKFEMYLKSIQKKETEFDGKKAQEIVQSFGACLVQHLNDEIGTITPYELRSLEQQELTDMNKKLEEHIKNEPISTVLCFVLTHHDPSTHPNWPPAPAPIKWFTRNIASRVNNSYWKFAPWTVRGEKQVYAKAPTT